MSEGRMNEEALTCASAPPVWFVSETYKSKAETNVSAARHRARTVRGKRKKKVGALPAAARAS
jgi:hypothetical protein